MVTGGGKCLQVGFMMAGGVSGESLGSVMAGWRMWLQVDAGEAGLSE